MQPAQRPTIAQDGAFLNYRMREVTRRWLASSTPVHTCCPTDWPVVARPSRDSAVFRVEFSVRTAVASGTSSVESGRGRGRRVGFRLCGRGRLGDDVDLPGLGLLLRDGAHGTRPSRRWIVVGGLGKRFATSRRPSRSPAPVRPPSRGRARRSRRRSARRWFAAAWPARPMRTSSDRCPSAARAW